MDRTRTDTWEAEGSTDLFERSRAVTDEILGSHFPNYFGAALDAKIREEFPIRLPVSAMRPG